ncbi:MAG TPA: DUF3263 domain-containing protein [Pseudoclavibacter sp.]|nr:DUF3263 domain-containing protein [Pseudoclavibacter sp.]
MDARGVAADVDVSAVLRFEREHPASGRVKAAAIRSQLGLSEARYYQLLYALIDSPEALVLDPMLVYRLRRLREARLEVFE